MYTAPYTDSCQDVCAGACARGYEVNSVSFTAAILISQRIARRCIKYTIVYQWPLYWWYSMYIRTCIQVVWGPLPPLPRPFSGVRRLPDQTFPYDFTSYVKSPEASGGLGTVERV